MPTTHIPCTWNTNMRMRLEGVQGSGKCCGRARLTQWCALNIVGDCHLRGFFLVGHWAKKLVFSALTNLCVLLDLLDIRPYSRNYEPSSSNPYLVNHMPCAGCALPHPKRCTEVLFYRTWHLALILIDVVLVL